MNFKVRWFSGLALLALGLGGPVLAQDGQGSGGGGFAGGGQMVRGTVTATAGDKLTVKTDTGEVYQVVTTTNTRVMKDRQPVKLGEIAVGSSIGAMGLLDAPTKTVHAMMVTLIDPEQAKKMREGMGKLFIMGKVTAIDETTLTILRTDNVTQKIEVDESTSFKRGGAGMRAMMSGGAVDMNAVRQGPPAESITLMDIKVGDSVGGQGAVKNGVFVPKELTVMAPRAGGGGGRRRNPDGTAVTPPAGAPQAPTTPQ